MDSYDPEQPPKPDLWLDLDEMERIVLVEEHHRRARVRLPNRMLHAAIHVVVENQLAMQLESVVKAVARLVGEGLSRHDAVHAVGSVLAKDMYDLMKGTSAREGTQGRYEEAVERLTAARWLSGDD